MKLINIAEYSIYFICFSDTQLKFILNIKWNIKFSE